jgi:hypothetical protein
MTIQLRGGHRTSDVRLDRVPHFDERSRSFSVADVLPSTKLRSRTWPCAVHLDQKAEGACVGFGWSHELAAQPVVVRGVTNGTARSLYRLAQTLDDEPGEAYEGTSVLAGAKAVQQHGFLGERADSAQGRDGVSDEQRWTIDKGMRVGPLDIFPQTRRNYVKGPDTPGPVEVIPAAAWLDLLDTLRCVYEPQGVGIWLFGACDIFGGRSAMDLIREGDMERVSAAAHALADGAFV